MAQSGDMAPSGELGPSAVQALLRDGTLAGTWTLDAARSTVALKTRHTWGLAPLQGAFRQVRGSLTIIGRTRPASFDATVSNVDGEVWLDGELQVNRADFGMSWNWMGIAAMRNTIVVHAVFTRQ